MTTKITEVDIQCWTGETSLSRGRPYFRQGAILNPRRQGDVLKAECQGSRPQPYRVEVTVGPAGIQASNCSCPVGGRCKHVAALLLTWMTEPDSFTSVADLETSLIQHSQAELIGLILKMVDRYPDLETLLELPTPGPAGAQPSLNPQVIRGQVRRAFHIGRDGWLDIYSAVEDLDELIERADGYIEQQNWADAAIIYEAVIRETLDNYEMIEEDDGGLGEIVNHAVGGLGECLAAATAPVQRETILRALFDTYQWDVDFGGIDMGGDAPDLILQHASPAERPAVVRWVNGALSAGDTSMSDYRRRKYGGFLLQLQADSLDDDSFMALCRQTGRLGDLVERLLRLGRVDEAAAEARQVGDYPLLELAPIFSAHGQDGLIEQIIRDRLPASRDRRLVQWLKERLLSRNDPTAALPLEERLFWLSPGTAAYQQLKAMAEPLGQWATLRGAVLARLEQEKKYGLLTELHLLENDVAQTLQTLPLVGQDRSGYYTLPGRPLSIQVARAAEGSYPEAAVDLYLVQVKALIDQRGRENYTLAAGYLVRVRELYQRLHQPAAWEKLIAGIYKQHSQLRALKEELARAGL